MFRLTRRSDLICHFRCWWQPRNLVHNTTVNENPDPDGDGGGDGLDDFPADRIVPKTKSEFERFDFKPDGQPENARLVRVAIVGCPNVGKSTLLNAMIQWKVSAVSSKVHTTRKNVIGVMVDGETQIQFFDTPGLVSRKHMVRHRLEPTFFNDLRYSARNCDIITVLADVSNRRERTRLNPGILELLQEYPDKDSILVLNKVDRIRDKRSLLETISKLTCNMVDGRPVAVHDDQQSDMIKFELKHGKFETLFQRTEKHYHQYEDRTPVADGQPMADQRIGWPNFSQVFMVSALHSDGLEQLRTYYVKKAQQKSWIYNGSVVTVQNPKTLIINALRQVCLEQFQQEIPYQIRFQIVMWETDDLGNLYLVVDVFVPEKFLSLFIGPKGATISRVVQQSRTALSDIFRCDVSLKIAAKPYKS